MRNHRNHRFFLKYPIFRRKKNGKDLMNIRHGHWCCSCQTHEERWHIQLIWDLPWSRWMIYFLRCQWSECLINPQESKMDKPEKCQEFSRFSRTLGSTWRWKTSSHYMQSLMATVKKVGGFQIWKKLRLQIERSLTQTNTNFALGTANQTRCMHKTTEPTKFWKCRCGGFSRSGKNCGYRSNGRRLKQTITTFALGTANQTRCMHKTTETMKFWGVLMWGIFRSGNCCGYSLNGGRFGQTNTTFALGTANSTQCMHKIMETTWFWGCQCGGFSRSGNRCGYS